MKSRKLSLSEAADKMAELTLRHLASLPPAERKKQTKAFKALAAEAASRARRHRGGKPAIAARSHRSVVFPVAARGK